MISRNHSDQPIHVGSRRWFLDVSLAGLGGLSLPVLSSPAAAGHRSGDKKAVIVFWLSGGPSQIDMWDPKPDASQEIRGPYDEIPTKIPGVRFCEHLPLQASIADKLTIIRSIDCSASNHTPITMQAGNPLARRTDDGRDGGGYPAMGSVAAKFRGPNRPAMPGFVGLADSWTSDVWGAGNMGGEFAPIKGHELEGRFARPTGISVSRLQDRENLRQELNRFHRDAESSKLDSTNRFTRQAFEMVSSGRVQEAFNIDQESTQTRDTYGNESIGQKALLARRLVEAGVTYVLVSGAWGYFDHHGDNVRWGGIDKGLTPLLPRVDRVLYALVNDLEQRGLLDSTLVMMLGEFGRSPKINTYGGRDHWLPVMSMVMAGGGLQHGQVVGATDRHGGEITARPVRPQDLAATTFKHLGIDLNSHWTDSFGRPIPIVVGDGKPISELF